FRFLAWVPLPLPGGPNRISRMRHAHSCVRGRNLHHAFILSETGRQGARCETYKETRRRGDKEPCFCPCLPFSLSPYLSLSVFRQARIVPHDEVAIDLLHQIERDADDDQQAGAAVKAGHTIINVHGCVDETGYDRDYRQERGT